ncbi:MAG: COGs COG3777, partial [uncultured Craurococcus sp.]
ERGAAGLGRPPARGRGGHLARHRPPHRRDARPGPGQLPSGRCAAAALVRLLLQRGAAASRYRPGRPPQSRRRAAAHPAAAPHGRRPPRDDPRHHAHRRDGRTHRRGRRHPAEAGAHRLHHRAHHAPHLPHRRPGGGGGGVRRRLPRGAEARRGQPRRPAQPRAGGCRLARGEAPLPAAGLPLLRADLERPPHPLRRRLRPRRGGLPRHGAEWRADHAAAARCRRRAYAGPPRRLHRPADAADLCRRHHHPLRPGAGGGQGGELGAGPRRQSLRPARRRVCL